MDLGYFLLDILGGIDILGDNFQGIEVLAAFKDEQCNNCLCK